MRFFLGLCIFVALAPLASAQFPLTATTTAISLSVPSEPVPADGVTVVAGEVVYAYACSLPPERPSTRVSLFVEWDAPWLTAIPEPSEVFLPIHSPCLGTQSVSAPFALRLMLSKAPPGQTAMGRLVAEAAHNMPYHGSQGEAQWAVVTQDRPAGERVEMSSAQDDEAAPNAVPGIEGALALAAIGAVAAAGAARLRNGRRLR
ncbi:MAG TPA: hypothetical protein VM681_01025 [Candidatus Thermoplasmatota archaeon]|nr:hypothetical protein [Candidatus Thermoplasmatota archaeon]